MRRCAHHGPGLEVTLPGTRSAISRVPARSCPARLQTGEPRKGWCPRGDSNSHDLSATAPSRQRVYQFHHLGARSSVGGAWRVSDSSGPIAGRRSRRTCRCGRRRCCGRGGRSGSLTRGGRGAGRRRSRRRGVPAQRRLQVARLCRRGRRGRRGLHGSGLSLGFGRRERRGPTSPRRQERDPEGDCQERSPQPGGRSMQESRRLAAAQELETGAAASESRRQPAALSRLQQHDDHQAEADEQEEQHQKRDHRRFGRNGQSLSSSAGETRDAMPR
jgi:hypothetical protein